MSRLIEKIKTKQQELVTLNIPMFVKVNEALENRIQISKENLKRLSNSYVEKNKSEQAVPVPKTNEQIGKIAGCGKTTVYEVEYLNKHASPELITNLIAGKVSIHSAYISTLCIKEEIGKKIIENNNLIKLYNADCFEIMPMLPDCSIDAIICDLPYAVTACKWDVGLPLDRLWSEYKRILKPNGVVILTATQPFTWKLCASNPEWFKYEIIWEKPNGTNPLLVKIQPFRVHENILVFYNKQPTYNPQKTLGHNTYGGFIDNEKTIGRVYSEGKNMISKHIANTDGSRYPRSIQKFSQERGAHPTKKPVNLMAWLVRSYTNAGDTVLDNTMGEGTTGVACVREGRKFIGIEMDRGFFSTAEANILEESRVTA